MIQGLGSIIVDDEARYAQYEHLSLVSVTVGQVVEEGDIIGETVQSGNAQNTTPHLHFEVRTQLNVGLGLTGRVNPNEILDTQFISQNPEANQTLTGVTKIENGSLINMNLDGSEIMIEDGRNNRPRTIILD